MQVTASVAPQAGIRRLHHLARWLWHLRHGYLNHLLAIHTGCTGYTSDSMSVLHGSGFCCCFHHPSRHGHWHRTRAWPEMLSDISHMSDTYEAHRLKAGPGHGVGASGTTGALPILGFNMFVLRAPDTDTWPRTLHAMRCRKCPQVSFAAGHAEDDDWASKLSWYPSKGRCMHAIGMPPAVHSSVHSHLRLKPSASFQPKPFLFI